MKAIRAILILLYALISLPMAAAQTPGESFGFSFDEESQIFIDGTSSLHDWTCDVEEISGGFIAVREPESQGYRLESGILSVHPDDIECGKRIMNGKLRKALAADAGSEIVFTLEEGESLSKALDESQRASETSFSGFLTIAGMTRPVTLTAGSSESYSSRLQFEGSFSLTMSDFGVSPPKALLGRLKTGDEVTIRFILVAKQTPLANS